MKDYFEILKISRDATVDEIKSAYRQLAKKYHPDLNKSPDAQEMFIEITEAYEVLTNPDLHPRYRHERTVMDEETLKAAWEKARRDAYESAQRFARMKYEKFVQEQEAFKKSGWYDIGLFLHYLFRIIVLPLIILFILLPLVSKEVSSDPSGYVAFWILALILLFYFLNNRKGYFKLGRFYYTFRHLRSLFTEVREDATEECYYCRGRKANSMPYKIMLFKIKSLELKTYGAMYGRKAGMNRKIQTISIPRSRKALIVHSVLPFIKISVAIISVFFLRINFLKDYALFLGFLAGGLVSLLVLLFTRTRSKVSYLLSFGMLIKISIWAVAIFFFKSYALLMLFFDPFIEATLRYISDKLFKPLIKQYYPLEILFNNDYQLYLELPVWSAIVPFFRWLF